MEIMTSVQISGQKLYQKRLERLWSRRELASNAGLTDALECAPADITAEK
jgi:hypothetical protein